MGGVPPQLGPLPGSSAPAVGLGFYLQFPSYHAPLFFLNILILLWGRGLSNEQDHF